MSVTTSDPTGYAPAGPLDESPAGNFATRATREAAMTTALTGVDLGEYDQRIVDWLLNLDDPTIRTLISLIWRARQAQA